MYFSEEGDQFLSRLSLLRPLKKGRRGVGRGRRERKVREGSEKGAARFQRQAGCEHEDAQENVRGHDDVGGRAQKKTRRMCHENRTETATAVAALKAATGDPKQ